MTVTASFSAGILTIFGDALDNTINISRDATGKILVNGGAITISGDGTPTVANTTLIQAFGQGGNDQITLNEANGALPKATLFGGAGNDILTGGSGGDQLFGQSGNDTLLGKGGNDLLFGGAENDVLTGGDGDDQVFGEAGNDRLVWNPGDDTDFNEGGNNVDTSEINGGNGAETFTVAIHETGLRVERTDPAPFSINLVTTENLVVNMNGGDDRFLASGNLSPLIQLTVDGGAGNDTISGGNGADVLLGGDGNDTVQGNQGNDSAFLGAGDDLFVWNPGDSNDVVEGQAGFDTLQFNGSNTAEVMDISANGERIRLSRNVGNITMDLDDVERINIAVVQGTDTITVNDLSGTDITQVNLDLSGAIGGSSADGQIDTIVLNSTQLHDVIRLSNTASTISVTGLPATVMLTNPDADILIINGGRGDDTIDSGNLTNTTVTVIYSGGIGNDTIRAGAGRDLVNGGDGIDLLAGGLGADTLSGGAGRDRFRFNALNEGSDIITDFASNETIEVIAGTFGGGLVAGQAITAEQFRIGSEALDASDRFIFNGSTRTLFFDPDGLGGLAKIQLATLQTNVAFSASNLRVL